MTALEADAEADAEDVEGTAVDAVLLIVLLREGAA